MNLSVKIDNKQYQQYSERKENAVYALKKKTDYKNSMKINVTKEKGKKRCYTCEKKRHLKKTVKRQEKKSMSLTK